MAGETVQFCPVCRCKTWHIDGVCEWSDGHERMEQARREQERRDGLRRTMMPDWLYDPE